MIIGISVLAVLISGVLAARAGWEIGVQDGIEAERNRAAEADPTPAGTPIPLSVKQCWNAIPRTYLEDNYTYEEAYDAWQRAMMWDRFFDLEKVDQARARQWVRDLRSSDHERMFMGQYPEWFSENYQG